MFEFDLADRVDDLICIFENGNSDTDMDTVSILLTGWITFLFFTTFLVKYIYRKFKGHPLEPLHQKQQENEKVDVIEGVTETDHEKLTKEQKNSSPPLITLFVNGTTPEKSRLTKEKEAKHEVLEVQNNCNETIGIPPLEEIPIINSTIENFTSNETVEVSDSTNFRFNYSNCTGSDPSLINFVTASLNWISVDESQQKKIYKQVNYLFLKSLNQLFHGIPHEDMFVASLDYVSFSDDLSLENLFAEYESSTHIKITCDCESKLKGQISLSSNLSASSSSNSEKYEFIVNRLVGRLRVILDIGLKIATFKFDGWPEICLALTNKSKRALKMDTKLSELVTSKLAAAIRCATINLHLDSYENFPVIPRTKKTSPPASLNVRKSFLLVQIKSGIDIGLHRGFNEAYCVLEMDNPPQKFQTHSKTLPHPNWDENFVIDTENAEDSELLLEIYSGIEGIFLGCNIISIDEITSGKKEFLRLKSRRAKISESITGSVELVFTFIDENDASKYLKPPIEKKSVLERNGSPDEAEYVNPTSSLPRYDDFQRLGTPPKRPPRHITKPEHQYGEERSRRKTRRGDVFTSVHRRSSKERSKSVVTSEGSESNYISDEFSRSASTGRSLGYIPGLNTGSSTSSSASELSQHSTSTFMHENSTILIEMIENGYKKYYLVPPEEIGKGKWKHKKKLHVFNDHTFVAKRIQNGLSCTVCFGRFPFSLRKQGYQCRDCRLISHKECHIRVPTYCLRSTIYDIDIITV